MPHPSTASVTMIPRIIEALYCEALVLSDEVRSAFSVVYAREDSARSDDPARPALLDERLANEALANEGLRTTTRMMRAIAWLRHHRAYFRGELDEVQLRRHGGLGADVRRDDARDVALLSPAIAQLVEATCRFYERMMRLDRVLGLTAMPAPSPLDSLRTRIAERLAG